MTRWKAFLSAKGQADNVGDSLLRRVFIQTLREHCSVHVLVDEDQAYNTGLGLLPEDEVYTSRGAWGLAAFRAAGAGDLAFCFNAGEVAVDAGYRGHIKRLQPLVRLNQWRGGRSIWAGAGIRHQKVDPSALRVLQDTLEKCDVVLWRDESSRELAGIGAVAPDWAFGSSSLAEVLSDDREDRDSIVVALRGDRGRPPEWRLDGVRAFAVEQQLRLSVVAQVGRDEALAGEVADNLGAAGLLRYEASSHMAHERALREAYREARVIVTDRLHAAVMAFTEGAMPVNGAPTPSPKLQAAFAAIDVDLPLLEDTGGAVGAQAVLTVLRRGISHNSVNVQLAAAREGVSQAIAGIASALARER